MKTFSLNKVIAIFALLLQKQKVVILKSLPVPKIPTQDTKCALMLQTALLMQTAI